MLSTLLVTHCKSLTSQELEDYSGLEIGLSLETSLDFGLGLEASGLDLGF